MNTVVWSVSHKMQENELPGLRSLSAFLLLYTEEDDETGELNAADLLKLFSEPRGKRQSKAMQQL